MLKRMNTPSNTIQKAIDVAGNSFALADALGVSASKVRMWKSRCSVPPQYVIPIEKATGVSRHELRPDIYPAEQG